MSKMQRVLLCGKSLIISGLQATLASVPGMDLQIVKPLPECVRERINTWAPDILILEAGLLYDDLSLSLLQEFPQLKLIGLDIEHNRMLVFTRSTAYEPTTEQLLQVIGR
jgi:hypothetical protein